MCEILCNNNVRLYFKTRLLDRNSFLLVWLNTELFSILQRSRHQLIAGKFSKVKLYFWQWQTKGGPKLFRLKCRVDWKTSVVCIIFENIANCLTFKPSNYKPRVKNKKWILWCHFILIKSRIFIFISEYQFNYIWMWFNLFCTKFFSSHISRIKAR